MTYQATIVIGPALHAGKSADEVCTRLVTTTITSVADAKPNTYVLSSAVLSDLLKAVVDDLRALDGKAGGTPDNTVCDVCGGRASACRVLGHRPSGDNTKWLP